MNYSHKVFTLIACLCILSNITFAQVTTIVDAGIFTSRSIQEFGVVNNRLIYVDADGEHLKATDGSNTFDLAFLNSCSNNPGSCFNGEDQDMRAVVLNNKYYFTYYDALWVTDGTPSGTQQLIDFESTNFGTIGDIEVFNGEIYFDFDVLYRYNENMSAPEPLADAVQYIFEMEVVNNQLYFYRIDFDQSPGWLLEYYVGDGTVAGSTLINAGPHDFTTNCRFADFYSLDNTYAFYEYTLCGVPEEFFINETQVPLEFHEYSYATINGDLYFAGNYNGVTGIYNYNNLNPQLSAAIDGEVEGLERLDNGTLVAITDAKVYSFTPGNATEILSFSQEGIFNVLLNTGNQVYFSTGTQFDDPDIKLWVTDGTVAGTQQVLDLNSPIHSIAELGGDLYFMQWVGNNTLNENLIRLFSDPNYNPPVPTLSTANTTIDGTPFQVTATFSQPVSGFNFDDIEAPGFEFSNLSGGPTVYTFTAQAFPSGPLAMQISNNAATNNQGVPSISGNLLSLNSTIDESTLCTTQVTGGSDFIEVTNNWARRYSFQLITNGQTVFQESGQSDYEFTIPDLEPGTYFYFITIRTNNFITICTLDGSIVIDGSGGCTDADNDGICAADDCNDNDAFYPATPGTACNDNNANTNNDVVQSDGCSCAGTPIDTGGGCQVEAGVSGNTILISGLPADANTKLFDANFGVEFECNPWNGNVCTGSEQVTGLPQGNYFLSVQSNDCDEFIPLTVSAAGTCELELTVSNFSCNNGEVTYDVFVTGSNTTGNTFTTSIQAGFGSIDQQFAYNQTHTITENFTTVVESVFITVWDTGMNTCSTTTQEQCPTQGGCNVAVNSSPGLIEVTGLPADANTKLFDSSFGIAFECNPWNNNVCTNLEQITGLVDGATYFLSVQSDECNEWIPVVYQAGGSGCTDNDGDGICVADDCNDNDASVPTSPGTSCNDGDSNTINDVIQNDGCTCQGTPNNSNTCTITALEVNGNIALSGLSPDMNLKVFDANFASVYDCNPWNNSPCSGTQVVTGLMQGATYFVSVVSDVCNEWIPITISGAASSQPDLTVSNLQIPGTAPQGGVMEYTFDLNNIGTTAVSGDYVINAFVSIDATLGSSDILVGEVFTGNTGVGTISGVVGAISLPNSLNTDYYLILVVDGDFEIAESNEGNNILVSSSKFVITNGPERNAPVELSSIKINNVFPNPANNDLFIQLNSATDTDFLLQLFDLSGKIVMERNMQMDAGLKSFEIDLTNVQAGMYQLLIHTDNKVLQQRIVKQTD